MKKFLSVFFILCIASAALAGGLAVLPHVHEYDFDHSQHKACPIYQAGLHSPAAITTLIVLSFVLFSAAFISSQKVHFVPQTYRFSSSSRAPPLFS